MKRFLSLFLAALILLSATACGARSAPETVPETVPVETVAPVAKAEGKAEALLAILEKEVQKMVINGGDEMNLYGTGLRTVDFSVLPAAYDMRDLGIVGPVRNQGNWGTCWGFAIAAASEISVLAELGITAEEFEQANGVPMDVSEKHLAWFANGALPKAEDYPEGQYPYPGIIAQAGEGIYTVTEETEGPNVRYDNGGMMAYGTGMFSAGVGPVMESQIPYAANDGSDSTAEDWSVAEESRFAVALELENSYILPSPAITDEEGNYIYNEYGTYAIKCELIQGRAVTIAYHADQAMNPEAKKNHLIDLLVSMGVSGTVEEITNVLRCITFGEIPASALTDREVALALEIILVAEAGITVENAQAATEGKTREEILEILQSMFAPAGEEAVEETVDEEAAAAEAAAAEEAAAAAEAEKRAAAERLGIDYDEFQEELQRTIAAGSDVYMNTENYSQYTNTTDAGVSHAVAIVGWDDNYSAENFLEGKRPPADGAWIVRNSWGEGYGNEGYFYLSYYDQTIRIPESFDFVTSYKAGVPTSVSILGMDYMSTGSYPTVRTGEALSYGNVFRLDPGMNVLRYISVLCGTMDAEITADVYLMNENAVVPSDGVLLDRVVKDVYYGGYYRIPLSHEFNVPEGSRIGVVVTQRSRVDDAVQYSLPYAIATTQAYREDYNKLLPENMRSDKYSVGCIGQGESWVLQNGQWYDWADIIGDLQESCELTQYVTYDNLGIKLYAYSMAELESLHNFDETVSYHGADMKICSDCSYSIVEP